MDISGFLLLNKPYGITSAQLLNQLKKQLPKGIKVGHAGTLDWFAQGLLIVGLSRHATKNLHRIMKLDKQYRITAQLGITTDTYDITGVIQNKHNIHTSLSDITSALHSFCPSYLQQPPLFSAKKHKGVRLSDLVRGGADREKLIRIAQNKAKRVYISQVKILDSSLPEFSFEVTVSHGTYIRALVHDLGVRLATGAVTKSLSRSAIGPWSLSDATTLKTLDLSRDILSLDSLDIYLNK